MAETKPSDAADRHGVPAAAGGRARKYRRLIVVAGTVVILDQISKAVILSRLALYSVIPVIPGFFNIIHIQNPGGAFGFMAHQSPAVRGFLFLLVSLLAAALIVWLYHRTPVAQRLLSFALALIFGGAVGNLIDRVRLGQVVDFLDFYLGAWHWPAFNVADSAISVGIGLFILQLLRGEVPD